MDKTPDPAQIEEFLTALTEAAKGGSDKIKTAITGGAEVQLARVLDKHLAEHPTRTKGCLVCTVILAHWASWKAHGDELIEKL